MLPTSAAGPPLWAVNLLLAGLVYIWNPRKAPNQAFAAFVLAVVSWSFCISMVYANTAQPSMLWGRLAFAAASLIGSSFVLFCQAFPERTRLSASKGSWSLTFLGALMAGLSLTPLVLREVGIPGTGGIQPDYGPLYPAFGVFILTAFGHGIWTLMRKWRTARGRSKLQIQYLSLGFCIALCGGTTTNLIMPALTGNSGLGIYGPYFSIFFVGLTTHAIIRHRLMDIRVVVSKGMTYGLSVAIAALAIWGIFAVAGRELTFHLHASTSALALGMAILGMVVFHPVRVAVQGLLDRYCYRQGYNYRHAIKTISRVLAGLLRADALCQELATFIFTTLKVEEVAVYLYDGHAVLERRSYQSASADGGARAEPAVVASPSIMALLARAGGPILYDERERWIDSGEGERLAEEFTALRSEVIVPLLVEDRIAALLTVGSKLSGDPFFTPDIELLSTIGHQAGVALKRVQLYEEVTWMKEYSESILRHMESGVIALSHDGLLTMINEAGARMLGVATTEVLGSPAERLIPCGLGLPLLDTLTGKLVYTNYEAVLAPASGPPLPIMLSTSVLRGRADEPAGAVLVFNDLSRIKALEEGKRRIERLAAIGAFSSRIAHEIKNPLVAIKTFAELLPERYADEEFRDTFARTMLHEVDRIDTLVQRLRGLSARSTSPLQPVSILAPLEEALCLLSAEVARRKIKVACQYDPALPPVMGDHDQLKQMFVNLCLNSLEAMGAGGTLTIAVRSESGQEGPTYKLIIEISDTGTGIPTEHLSNIFEPFFTLKAEGTGLGLAICQGIIDYHRGSIVATNRADSPGALFTLTLPAAEGEAPHEVPTSDR
ncbi:MAG TPA: ATP-binding protein [Alphaproteobacteria bacterium]|nr:ATP-binding protein [Alphaproteobacteria bacterium]